MREKMKQYYGKGIDDSSDITELDDEIHEDKNIHNTLAPQLQSLIDERDKLKEELNEELNEE